MDRKTTRHEQHRADRAMRRQERRDSAARRMFRQGGSALALMEG